MSRRLTFTRAEIVTRRLERNYARALKASYDEAYAEIVTKLALANARYGDLTQDTLGARAVVAGREVTRLTKLEAELRSEIARLNRGQPQKFASFLTDSYVANYQGAATVVQNVAPIDINFAILDRQKIYETAVQPMGKIALDSNRQGTWLNIQRAMTQSIVQGENIKAMTDRIQTALGQNANNAMRIARTENTRVSNKARLDVFEQAQDKGIKLEKLWISAIDTRTRDHHLEMDGETRPMDKPFSNGLMYPGDQTGGDASETINCRCAMGTILID